MKRVALHTLGCKLNYAETSAIGRQFTDRGYTIVDAHEPSEVFVLNTCSVTDRADRECRQLIRRALRISPDAYVVVIGCYAQLRPEDLKEIAGVDLILGTREKFRIFEHAGAMEKRPLPDVFVSCIDEASDFEPASSAGYDGRTRAFLKVQDGCDYRCSFCTIPAARGASRSVPVPLIVEQARQLGLQGYREVVLTGVNVGDYGRSNGSSFHDLLRALEDVTDVERFRISSVEPNLLTPGVIDLIVGSERFCNHFHVPLQSGSAAVLRAMRRRYTPLEYRSVIERIRLADPEAGIGADIIAGFPGESGTLFDETRRFLADLPISYLHVFTYSERPDTDAPAAGARVDPRIRFERSSLLRSVGERMRAEFHSRFVGAVVPVLAEGDVNGGMITGLTTNYIRVEFPADPGLANTIVPVELRSSNASGCIGVQTEPIPETVCCGETLTQD